MVALFDLRFFFQGEGGEVKDCGVECGLHRHELELWLVSTGDTFLGYGEIHNLTRWEFWGAKSRFRQTVSQEIQVYSHIVPHFRTCEYCNTPVGYPETEPGRH